METNDPVIIIGVAVGALFAVTFGIMFFIGIFLSLADQERRNGR
jgi:hypothetical protein